MMGRTAAEPQHKAEAELCCLGDGREDAEVMSTVSKEVRVEYSPGLDGGSCSGREKKHMLN